MGQTIQDLNQNLFPERLRTWRRMNRIKQEWLASMLGVTQAAVSRWEAGTDRPRPTHMGKLIDLMEKTLSGPISIERRFTEAQPGMASLLRLDGMRLLAVSKSYKAAWPEFSRLIGTDLADSLVDEAAEVRDRPEYRHAIDEGALAMVSGISFRHTSMELDHALPHRWHACFRKQGPLVMVQVVYEPCDPALPTGIDRVLNLDTVRDGL